MVEEVQVRAKEIRYRGKSVEELKSLDTRESANFLPSRSRRSILRNFDVIEKFIKNCERKEAKGKKIKTHKRDIVIVPRLIGKTISVHNGRGFQDIQITFDMLGHRLGEFALTRKKVTHTSAGVGATKGSRAKKK